MQFHCDNINDAFKTLCYFFHRPHPQIIKRPSRYGFTFTIDEPVTITYANPLKRVLFHPVRDCNPFFHLMEAMWMLAGQNRVQPMSYFVSRIAAFSDDDLTLGEIPLHGRANPATDFTTGFMWGAYGYRWRKWFERDQLETVIRILRKDPSTRRCVLQMWEPRDLQRVLGQPDCKDVPCNTEVMFSCRQTKQGLERRHAGQHLLPREERPDREPQHDCYELDTTVINRSNDLLWGALGSNYVTFSILQEYVANSCGFAVGRYHQVSNNLHVYVDPQTGLWSQKWQPEDLITDSPQDYSADDLYVRDDHYSLFVCPYDDLQACELNRQRFDNILRFLFSDPTYLTKPPDDWHDLFYVNVIYPMLVSYHCYRTKEFDRALRYAGQIVPYDWRVACTHWLRRRANKRQQADAGAHHAV